jgi:hypothetical protein
MRIAWEFNPVALQSTDVIRVAEFGSKFLENRLVALLALAPNFTLVITHQVNDYAIIV